MARAMNATTSCLVFTALLSAPLPTGLTLWFDYHAADNLKACLAGPAAAKASHCHVIFGGSMAIPPLSESKLSGYWTPVYPAPAWKRLLYKLGLLKEPGSVPTERAPFKELSPSPPKETLP